MVNMYNLLNKDQKPAITYLGWNSRNQFELRGCVEGAKLFANDCERRPVWTRQSARRKLEISTLKLVSGKNLTDLIAVSINYLK